MYFLIGVILSGVVLVIYFRRGRNAVWGGATIGLFVGGAVGLMKGDVLNCLGWGFIGGTLVGLVSDLLGVLSDRLKRRRWRRFSESPEGTEVNAKLSNLVEEMADRQAKRELAIAAAWEEFSGLKSKRYWGVSNEFLLELVDEFGNFEAVTESIKETLTEADLDELFATISDSQALSLEEQAVADYALLGMLEGYLPSQRGQSLLRSLFGDELLDKLLAKRDERNAKREKP